MFFLFCFYLTSEEALASGGLVKTGQAVKKNIFLQKSLEMFSGFSGVSGNTVLPEGTGLDEEALFFD